MTTYRQAGVDLEAGRRALRLMEAAVRSTYSPQVLAGHGSFGGMYDASRLASMDRPVLVASTDGVGTKTMVAARLGRWDTLGQDLVHHCLNDVLVQGARPLFFLDYVASARLDPEQVAVLVEGMAAACRRAGCVLLGGETAEMPGVYRPGQVDLVGTMVGVVEGGRRLEPRRWIRPGDLILGLPSSGLHTNGYSLARRVLEGLDWSEPRADLGTSIGEALLAVHTSYLEPVGQMLEQGTVHGLAHITGGGIAENLERILPPEVDAVIHKDRWVPPPLFALLAREGRLEEEEMFRVFNMGLGMLVVVPPGQLPPQGVVVGEIVPGRGRVHLR